MIDLLDVMSDNPSRLSIGLDPPSETEDRVSFALNIIEETHEYAICYKPNLQFWLGTGSKDLKHINEQIHKYGLPSIADIKLSDIGNTNNNSIKNLSKLGFDYLTHSPFPGNLKETAEFAKNESIGIITLVVMSNPEAEWMVDSGLYRKWADGSNQFSDGIVLGTTNHVTKEILEEISSSFNGKFVLAPGIGSQGGNVRDLRDIFGDRVIFNVSRGIGLSENPGLQAKKYYEITIQN